MTTIESLGTPPPSCQMDGAQEEMWCFVNTPSVNFNFRLFICHFHEDSNIHTHPPCHIMRGIKKMPIYPSGKSNNSL
jgi:hypothetical protein